MVGPREKIQSLRVRNIDSKHFIPAESLNPILNNQVVNEVVMDCDVKQYRQSEVANLIVRGGRRTFAILIMIRRESLILRFVEKDELQGAWLDSKLPFSLPALKSILSDTDAIDFYDKQWEFVSPIFSPSKGHRELHDDTVLPFSGEPRRRGDGGFGFVAEIDVHPKHTTFAKANDNKVGFLRMRF